jgi:hypothetical protein
MLDQAVHLTNKFQTDRSGGARNLKDEWLTDISATLCKVVSRNYRNSICGNLHGDPPVHTLFPSLPQPGHPSVRLSLLRSPLCTPANQPQRGPPASTSAPVPPGSLSPVSASHLGAPAPPPPPPPPPPPCVERSAVTSVSPLSASQLCAGSSGSPPLSPGTLAVNVLRDVAATFHPGRLAHVTLPSHLSPLACNGGCGATANAPLFSPPNQAGHSVSAFGVSPCRAT